jgi:hypothetical protein
MDFSNEQSVHYRSNITNEWRKVTCWCPLLITHICNGNQTMTVTITSHQSCEMVVSLGPQGTLVTGTNTDPVTRTQHPRCVFCTCISYILTEGDTSYAHMSPLSRQKKMHLLHARLVCLGERRRVLTMRVSPISKKGERVSHVSRRKETHVGNARLLYLDERRRVLWTRISYDPPMSWFLMHLIKLDPTSKFTKIHIIHMHHITKYNIITSQVKKHHWLDNNIKAIVH